MLDNATFVDGSIDPAAQASFDGDHTLTWNLPAIAPGGDAYLHYRVTVNADQWNQTLTNTATPGPGGECLSLEAAQLAAFDSCSTTTGTPSYTLLAVHKSDQETGESLPGAEFTLYQDNAPYADPSNPQVGAEDEQVGTATSGADGVAQFAAKLQKGHFLVEETAPPAGYADPLAGKVQAVVVDETNYVANEYMSAIEFQDPATGSVELLSKTQLEQDPLTGDWVPSDGYVDYGDQVKYVISVKATGPQRHHDLRVTDYVPGYDPADVTSTDKATLVAGSPQCTGDLTGCAVSVGADNQITFDAGTVTDATGTAEFVVTFPQLPTRTRLRRQRVLHHHLVERGRPGLARRRPHRPARRDRLPAGGPPAELQRGHHAGDRGAAPAAAEPRRATPNPPNHAAQRAAPPGRTHPAQRAAQHRRTRRLAAHRSTGPDRPRRPAPRRRTPPPPTHLTSRAPGARSPAGPPGGSRVRPRGRTRLLAVPLASSDPSVRPPAESGGRGGADSAVSAERAAGMPALAADRLDRRRGPSAYGAPVGGAAAGAGRRSISRHRGCRAGSIVAAR